MSAQSQDGSDSVSDAESMFLLSRYSKDSSNRVGNIYARVFAETGQTITRCVTNYVILIYEYHINSRVQSRSMVCEAMVKREYIVMTSLSSNSKSAFRSPMTIL